MVEFSRGLDRLQQQVHRHAVALLGTDEGPRRIEGKALVHLSTSLAPIDNAPIEVVRRLSRHDEITIAAPVLGNSTRLSESDLIDIAKSKGQGHLLAISGRASLPVAAQIDAIYAGS